MSKGGGLTLLLGAGFAKWAADLPIANELFEAEIEPFGPRDEQRAEIVRRAREKWLQQHADGTSEQFIGYALAQDSKLHNAVIWYIVRRLSEPYVWREWHAGKWRRHVLMIDEHRKRQRPGVSRAHDLLHNFISKLDGIITPNYDLLVEYALGTSGFNYGRPNEILSGRGPYPVSQWKNPVSLRGRISIAKIHGSISRDRAGRRHTDGRGGITGDALIVAPAPEKTQPTELAFEWKLSETILRQSTELVVFGFAFNPYDEALLAHLKQSGQKLERVTIVDPSPKTERARALWPGAAVLSSPPPIDGEDLTAWYARLRRL